MRGLDIIHLISSGAAITTRRLLFMVCRSFFALSKAAFSPLYCAIVMSRLEFALEANSPNLRVDANQLERVLRHATRVMRGLRQVRYEEGLRQIKLFSRGHRRLRDGFILSQQDFQRCNWLYQAYRILQEPCRLRRRSDACSVRIVKYWNRLLASLVMYPLVSVIK